MLTGELIEGEVLVKRTNHIVPIGRDVVSLVSMIPHGVGEADEVEPVDGEAFRKVRRGKELVDPFSPDRIPIAGVVSELLDVLGGRGKPEEIEMKPSHQGDLVGGRGGRDPFFFETGKHEVVDPVGWPVPVRYDRRGDFLGFLIGPGDFIGRALFDPSLEEDDLFRRQ